MVSETMNDTSDNGYKQPDDATAAIASDLGDLGSNFISLVELQTELFVLDAREAASRAVGPGAMTVLAIAFVLGACPLALLGLAWALAAWTPLSAAAAAILVAVIAFVAAGILGWAAVRGFRRCATAMKGSVAECRRNLRWLKTLLKRERRYRAAARSRL